MELTLTGRLKRSGQTTQTRSAAEPAKKFSARGQARADRLALSKQAIAFLEENNRRVQEKLRQEAEKKKREGLENKNDCGAGSLLDGLDKAMDVMQKCHKIAAAIMKGKRVPPEDLRYLMEHDPNGYKLAMAMREPVKDDEEVESVLDEEDRRGGSASESSEGGGTSAPAPTASSAEDAGSSGGESGGSSSAE